MNALRWVVIGVLLGMLGVGVQMFFALPREYALPLAIQINIVAFALIILIGDRNYGG